jgi:hypothetical protein
MILSEIILGCKKYIDSDEFMYQVFAKKIDDKFDANSEAVALKLTLEEMEMDLADISNSKCPGFDYFLEGYILQDLYKGLEQLDEYRTDNFPK